MTQPSGYDIIGDIHGQADALQALLKKLGYCDWGGVWRYPGGARQAIFVGDYIDRNPNARQVLDIVRRMMESGEALAVMGNHEFNAVAYHTPDPKRPGEHLRAHSPKNLKQHQVFLKEMENNEAAHDAAIAWFRSLPMWLDLGELRVVHASWVPRYRAVVEREANSNAHLSDALLVKATCLGSEEFNAVECLLKGLEVRMPEGVGYHDSYGRLRTRARVRWWLNEAPALLRDAIVASPAMVRQIGDVPWHGAWPADAGYAADAPPVFIGHYWLDGEPEPLANNVACVDYSAAKVGKKLAAYRWDGEQRLRKSYFVSVAT
ncbi:MAG: metallophosphoesterase [Gammaproteobacteria bacterium]